MAAARHGTPPSGGSRPRILRIGIILGGNIVEERLVRTRETITIGQSSKNTFSVPIEGLPKQWPLVSIEGDHYSLVFTEAMDGRISDGKGVRTLESLKGREATRKGEAWSVALSESSRGKIVIGDMTLLFQFVTAPPLQPRPRLPASVRGTFADRLDPHLAIILAISLVLHAGLAIYAWQRDLPMTTVIDRAQEEYTEETYKERTIARTFDMPLEGTATEVGTEAEVEAKPQEKPKSGGDSKKAKGPPKEDSGDDGGAPDDAAIREAVASSAFLKVATGGEGDGSRYDQMSNTDQGAGLDKAIDNVKKSGAGVATRGRGGEGDRRSRGPQSGELGTGKGPGVKGPAGGTQVAEKEEEEIKSRVNLTGVVDLEDTTLDPESVARRIREKYLAGIKRCHQRALKADPNAGGRVTLRFTVGPSGNVTDSSVKGFDPSVDSCIQGLTRKWRFAAPKTDGGAPTSAVFQIPLILRPGE